jgi:hypothetical protein
MRYVPNDGVSSLYGEIMEYALLYDLSKHLMPAKITSIENSDGSDVDQAWLDLSKQ